MFLTTLNFKYLSWIGIKNTIIKINKNVKYLLGNESYQLLLINHNFSSNDLCKSLS